MSCPADYEEVCIWKGNMHRSAQTGQTLHMTLKWAISSWVGWMAVFACLSLTRWAQTPVLMISLICSLQTSHMIFLGWLDLHSLLNSMWLRPSTKIATFSTPHTVLAKHLFLNHITFLSWWFFSATTSNPCLLLLYCSKLEGTWKEPNMEWSVFAVKQDYF